jgi:hypothetical protein
MAPIRRDNPTETDMGKYVLGWFLGIPLGVLVILYLIFH